MSDSDNTSMGSGREWIPDEALESMVMERSVHRNETNKKTATRLVEENAPLVAQSMIHLAIYSQSERIRLDAGKYLLDRTLGRIGEAPVAEESSPIRELIESVMSDIDRINK